MCWIWRCLHGFALVRTSSGLIHRSERGVQYRSVVYGEALAESKVVSFSRFPG